MSVIEEIKLRYGFKYQVIKKSTQETEEPGYFSAELNLFLQTGSSNGEMYYYLYQSPEKNCQLIYKKDVSFLFKGQHEKKEVVKREILSIIQQIYRDKRIDDICPG